MASSELDCVMEATKSDGTTGSYYVYRKNSSYSITPPNGLSYLCHDSVKNIENVKSEIWTVFSATVTKVTPSSLLG